MTKKEFRGMLIYLLTDKMLPSEAIPKVDSILTLTDQYYREAGWKSPEEVDYIHKTGYNKGYNYKHHPTLLERDR